LADYRVKKDAVIFFSSYVNHRLPGAFERPTTFDPERWATGMPAARRAVYAPFGIGTHSCIAMYFATAEMMIILAMILQRFRLRIPGRTKVNRGMRFSLIPSPDLMMRIDRCGAVTPRAEVFGNIRESVELS
jgi:cytochrome P450